VNELWQAIEPYAGWIVFGVLLLLMMRMRGGCCGMGHGSHDQRQSPNPSEAPVGTDAPSPRESRSADDSIHEERAEPVNAGRHLGGTIRCH
jgi:hypothetical protein